MATLVESNHITTYKTDNVLPLNTEGNLGDKVVLQNGDEYEKLSNGWINIKQNGIIFSSRSFNSETDLLSISDAQLGETLIVKSNSTDKFKSIGDKSYVVTHVFDKYAKALKILESGTTSNLQIWLSESLVNTTSDEMIIVFKINPYLKAIGGNTARIIDFNGQYLGHLYSGTDGSLADSYSLVNVGININYVKEFETGFISGNSVKTGIWYEVSFNLLSDYTGAVRLLRNIPNGSLVEYELKNIKTGSEEWKLNETSGDVATSVGGKVFNLEPTFTSNWIDFNTTSRFSKFLGNEAIANLVINNNTINPLDLGLDISLNNELQFTNDAWDILQFCLDSDFDVIIPAGNYYVSKPLVISKPKHIKMFGNNINTNIYNNDIPDFLTYYKNNKSTTVIYSDQNIDMVDLRSHSVKTENGVILTALIPNHTKGGLKINVNFDITNCKIYDISVYGNLDTLDQEGNGTKGIYINSDQADPNIGIGFMSGNKITGWFWGCHTALSIPKFDYDAEEDVTFGTYYLNWNTFDLYTKLCKKYVDVQISGLSKFTITPQMGNITNLAPSETNFWGIYINCSNSFVDVFPMDANRVNKIKIDGNNNTMGPQTARQIEIGAIKVENIGSSKILGYPREIKLVNDVIRQPISKFHNQITYFKDHGGIITVKSYDAPDMKWFSTHLDDSETEGLVVDTDLDASTNEFDNFGGLLSAEWEKSNINTKDVSFINKKETGFVEVIINATYPTYPDLQKFITNTKGDGLSKIQIIVKTTDTTPLFFEVSKDRVNDLDFVELGRTFKHTDKVIVRFIGVLFEKNATVNAISSAIDVATLTGIEDIGVDTVTIESVTGESSSKTNTLKLTGLLASGGVKQNLKLLTSTVYSIDLYAKVDAGNSGNVTININDLEGVDGADFYGWSDVTINGTAFTKYHLRFKTKTTNVTRYLTINVPTVGDIVHIERLTAKIDAKNSITDLVYLGVNQKFSPTVNIGGNQEVVGLKEFKDGIRLSKNILKNVTPLQLPHTPIQDYNSIDQLKGLMYNMGLLNLEIDVFDGFGVLSEHNSIDDVSTYTEPLGQSASLEESDLPSLVFPESSADKALKSTVTDDTQSISLYITKSYPNVFVVGEDYNIIYYVRATSNASGYIRMYNSTGTANTIDTQFPSNVVWQKKTKAWTAVHHGLFFRVSALRNASNVNGDYMLVAGISIEKASINYNGDSGTILKLDKPTYRYYNMNVANASEGVGAYTISDLVTGGKAKMFINTPNESPQITGANLNIYKGNNWISGTDMYMFVEFNGQTTDYWFEIADSIFNGIKNITSTSYSFIKEDIGFNILELENASAISATVEPESTTDIPNGKIINITAKGVGQVTIVEGTGVTVNTTETLKLRKQHSTATLKKTGTNEWLLTGDLEVV